jgi:hypothetical protein
MKGPEAIRTGFGKTKLVGSWARPRVLWGV